MSYQIDYSIISNDKDIFDNYYAANIHNPNQAEVNAAVQTMSCLAETLIPTLQTTRPCISGFFVRSGLTQTVDKQETINDITTKLSALIDHSMKISAPSLTERVTPILPPRKITPPLQPNPAQITKTNAVDYAVGFCNMSNNCWANSLLSMVVCVPSLKQVYIAVATHCFRNGSAQEKKCGSQLIYALKSYEIALLEKRAVPSDVSQNVRLAFHGLFGSVNAISGRETFSASPHAPEDACEALGKLITKYLDIGQNNPLSSLFCSLNIIRRYAPNGEEMPLQREDREHVPFNLISNKPSQDYQILVDMQNNGHLSFPDLLSHVFDDTTGGDEDVFYKLPNGNEKAFKVVGKGCQFVNVPDEFILTLERFGRDNYGNGFKIHTSTQINRVIVLPAIATSENKAIGYELDSFICHSGEFGGGHYICYKKIEDRWIEVNDGSVRFVDPAEIDAILHGSTNYVHHYARSGWSANTVPLAAELLAEVLVNECDEQLVNAQLAIKALEALPSAIQNDSDCLKNVPDSVLGTLRHAIWLNDKTPEGADYGTNALKENPKKLFEIKSPWLIGKTGTTLLDQMLTIQKKKLEIASEQVGQTQIQAFNAKLKNSACNNVELHRLFKALPDAIRWKLQEYVYLNHKEKLGAATVHKHSDYGLFAVTQEDLRKTLTEARNESGANVVDQLANIYNAKIKNLQNAYEKEQLQAFGELLADPTLTTYQLEKAFERLEINDAAVRKEIFKGIWLGHNKPEGDGNYGGNAFSRNPRCLLEIQKPVLCTEGANLLEQMIALLEKDS